MTLASPLAQRDAVLLWACQAMRWAMPRAARSKRALRLVSPAPRSYGAS
jgi:hypothetical protein